MKKMLVVDGNSILNRAFYGIRLLTNKEGLYTNAVYGMVNILSKPKNSLVKQYKKLISMDGAELEFEDAACRAIAKEAIEKKTGARGLRSIMENLMQALMYEIPSRQDVAEVIIHQNCVDGKADPEYVLKEVIALDDPSEPKQLPSS